MIDAQLDDGRFAWFYYYMNSLHVIFSTMVSLYHSLSSISLYRCSEPGAIARGSEGWAQDAHRRYPTLL